jgi:hypothetical protein
MAKIHEATLAQDDGKQMYRVFPPHGKAEKDKQEQTSTPVEIHAVSCYGSGAHRASLSFCVNFRRQN